MIKTITFLAVLLFVSTQLALSSNKDVMKTDSLKTNSAHKINVYLYDSLAIKASKHRFTRWLYGSMICQAKETEPTGTQAYDYFNKFRGKTIASVSVKPLKVFGPTFDDTVRNTSVWLEKVANKLHSKSNMYVIRKNLWIKEGQQIDPDLLMDNENLLRNLPYLKDARIVIMPQVFNENLVDVLVLTQDVFSFGIDGSLGNINQGDIEVFDKNILGMGHEIRYSLVAHTDKVPHVGFESFYSINNVKGNFINFSAGYADTYLKKGYMLNFGRDFLRPQTVNAGGLSVFRSFRFNYMSLTDRIESPSSLNYLSLDGWYGRKVNLGINKRDSRFQATLSGRVRFTHFYDRPLPDLDEKQYFSNSTLYIGSLSFSHRSYIQDRLVYSYGITEDIPKGYLCEIAGGFDNNEFGNRWYSHIFLSTGNMFRERPFYMYTSLGVGGFFKHNLFEQGIVDAKIDFISQLFNIWNVKARQFIKLNYTLGINRFGIEDILLRNDYGIRGFSSQIGKGKQRLVLNIENVFFQNKSVMNFKSAVFSFVDIGLIGPSNESIFQQKYYAGVGLGLRIRNENLVFKTIQFRFAYYPDLPGNVSNYGFIVDGVSKTRFYSFQPRGPEPLQFQ